MNNGKNIAICIISLLLLFSILNISNVRAGFNLDDLDIDVKGQFQYIYEKFDETVHIIMTATIIVENKTVIFEVNNNNFEAKQIDINRTNPIPGCLKLMLEFRITLLLYGLSHMPQSCLGK